MQKHKELKKKGKNVNESACVAIMTAASKVHNRLHWNEMYLWSDGTIFGKIQNLIQMLWFAFIQNCHKIALTIAGEWERQQIKVD